MSSRVYFNYPIELLDGFMIDSNKVLSNILDYACYVEAEKQGYSDIEDKMNEVASILRVSFGSYERVYKDGKKLYKNSNRKSPKVGINASIYWDYHKNEKTDFEKVCLLGFLALKSILQQKAYCKVTNLFWWSRMDGKAKAVKDISELSKPIQKYANFYQARKIKTALLNEWGLVTYSHYTRGFYVSFKLNLDKLVLEAEKRRKSTKEKQYKQSVDLARQKALKELYK